MLRRHTAALTFTLIGGLLGSASASQASPILLAQTAGDTCGLTTGNTVIYDQPRRDSPIVAQIAQAGRQLSLDPDFATGDWIRVTTPSVAGFTLARYLEGCGATAAEATADADESSSAVSNATPGVIGSCATAIADRSSSQLSVRTEAGATASYNAIAAGANLILSAEPALYSPEQGRYWRKVLAYSPLQASRSRTGEAWISETGPNTPRLIHNSSGILVNRQAEAYPDLNIVRRPCDTLFPNASIIEGRPLPRTLPTGYRTP